MCKRRYISHLIGKDYERWRQGDRVVLEAPTGSGKTQFIIKELLPWVLSCGKRILLCVNRELLKKQLIYELCVIFGVPPSVIEGASFAEFPGITVTTYQTIQEILKQGEPFPKGYEYIVLDEIHYLIVDSEFNPEIQYFAEQIPRMRYATVIFISATITEVLPYVGILLGEWDIISETEICTVYQRMPVTITGQVMGWMEVLWYYKVPQDRIDYEIFAYDDISQVVEIINEDTTDEKYLIFQSNKTKAKKNFSNALECEFEVLTADDKGNKVYTEIAENAMFSAKALITTKLLDNGISLKDPKLKAIVLDTPSRTEFLQMLGRKRFSLEESHKLKIFLPIKKIQYFQGLLELQIIPALKVMDMNQAEILDGMLQNQDVHKACKSFFCIRDGKLSLNEIARDELWRKRRFCEKIVQEMKKDPLCFLKEQLSWLGVPYKEEKTIFLSHQCISRAVQRIQDRLLELDGKTLDKAEQKAFRSEISSLFDLIIPGFQAHKSLTIGIAKINAGFKLLSVPYVITSIPGKKKGETTKWKVERIDM